VRLARKLRPDVILMDISMPVMDGFEATRIVREQNKGACVLMLTGSNSRTDVDHARQAGAAGYVTKDRIGAELIDDRRGRRRVAILAACSRSPRSSTCCSAWPWLGSC
jgi:CheY-like chemotaxis protein